MNTSTLTPKTANRLARMGILQEPAGYVDGLNLFEYVRSNPTGLTDPLGLYTLNFGPGFTTAEQQKIRDAFVRVQNRVNSLMREIDDALANEKCQPIIDKLNQLRSIIKGMQSDLVSNRPSKQVGPKGVDNGRRGDHFDLTKTNFNPDAPLRWTNGPGTNIEFNNGARKPWNAMSDEDFNSTLFHELTHEQGTDDGEAGDFFNDAHMIDNLMNSPLSKWAPLRAERMNSTCPCAAPTTQP